MAYEIELIGPEERNELFERYEPRYLYSSKCEIHGTCIRLLTDQERTNQIWGDNFYNMSESVRSHGRLIVLDDPEQRMMVKYEPLTRTAFLFNIDYYGWVKSIALALASDILEDQHRIYSVHGAALDVGGRGVTLIAPSKSGKTTHSWGLLRMNDARLVTDDWFFVQMSTRKPLAYGSEKNFYVEGDIASIWPEYQGLVDRATFDNKGRAIVNVRWTVGQGGVVPMTTMRKVILLKRDREDPRVDRKLEVGEAMDYLERNNFCNPHQLVRDDRKIALRRAFFRSFLEQCEVHMVNTVSPPLEVQEVIRRIACVTAQGSDKD
ncbi:MAG: hypothetical protein ISF22_10885 [Methanomassiliicoccus sp.]|nr:hypothetical protein [Methanomassiliicoccus sp.]